MRFDYDLKKYPYILFFAVCILNILGIFVRRSAVNAEGFTDPQVVRHIIGSCAGICISILISFLDYRKLFRYYRVLYTCFVLLLIGVLVYGTASGHGAVRWIQLPLLGQVQPAEFVKPGLILTLSAVIQKMDTRIDDPACVFQLILISAVPIFLVLLQPNLSTAVILSVITASVIASSQISYKWILAGLLTVAVFSGIFIYLFNSGLYDRIPFLQGYQVDRILTFLNPAENTQTYYQQLYSIMAIASGEMSGKGLNNSSVLSVKNGRFLAEQDNDFIFAVIGEELGFKGALLIIILFLLIIYECFIIALRARTSGGRTFAAGMMTWIGFQTFTNMAVATGIFPNTGITLPFFSRGTSSLMAVYIGLGVVSNIALLQERRRE